MPAGKRGKSCKDERFLPLNTKRAQRKENGKLMNTDFEENGGLRKDEGVRAEKE